MLLDFCSFHDFKFLTKCNYVRVSDVASFFFLLSFKVIHQFGEWKYGLKNSNFFMHLRNIYNNFYFKHIHSYFMNNKKKRIKCKQSLSYVSFLWIKSRIYFYMCHIPLWNRCVCLSLGLINIFSFILSVGRAGLLPVLK